MKIMTKFLTLVLSLFCVFGLTSPVYAEEMNDLDLVEYKLLDSNFTHEGINENYFLQVGKEYTLRLKLQGNNGYDLTELINQYSSQLNGDVLTVTNGAGDTDKASDSDQTVYGIDLNFTPTKEGKVTFEIVSGKTVSFYVHNDQSYSYTIKIDEIFQEKCKSLYITSADEDAKPAIIQKMKEAIAEAGLEENEVYYEVALEGMDVKKIYSYGIGLDGSGCDGLISIPLKIVIPQVEEGAPTTTVSSDVDAIVENTKASYSTEQQAALTDGGSANVKVSVSKTTPSDEDKKLVDAQLNSTNTVAMYLDLGVKVSVMNKDGDQVGDDVTISETGTAVKFTVALDDSFINTNNTVDRTYQVVRIHNGVVDVLPASFDADSKTITFETDKFSTYALMYTDTPKASKTPATADGMNVAVYGGVAVISVLAIGLLFFFKKRNA